MMEEVELGSAAMKHLCRLLPPGGLRDRDRVEREMDDMISPEYEPYFSANAALHLLAACQRCGRCCREEKRKQDSVQLRHGTYGVARTTAGSQPSIREPRSGGSAKPR